MRYVQLTIIILLFFSFNLVDAAPKMRPYSGIGVLRLSALGPIEPVPLYDDPGIGRCCKLEIQIVKDLNNWLFGVDQGIFLLVTARKGRWLEIERDDAGRTGWIMPERFCWLQPARADGWRLNGTMQAEQAGSCRNVVGSISPGSSFLKGKWWFFYPTALKK